MILLSEKKLASQREAYYKLKGYAIPGMYRLYKNGIGRYSWRLKYLLPWYRTPDWLSSDFPNDKEAMQWLDEHLEHQAIIKAKHTWRPIDGK